MLAGQVTKSLIKRILPKKIINSLRVLKHLIGDSHHIEVPFDNQYSWLNYTYSRLMSDPRCWGRPSYVWGVAQGAALAKVLGHPGISVVEFGVAGGCGLIALENIAGAVSRLTDIGIEVFGFDTGAGLPPPADVRDQPNLWYGGQLPMDKQKVSSRLERAKLHIGPVKDTLGDFINDRPPPVAFISFDMDLYSSTRDALRIFEADHTLLLPRVFSYFDDIFGYTFNDFCGERLAIAEFNSNHVATKICPIYGLRYFIPRAALAERWPDGMYIAHLFGHKMYNLLDSINKPISVDIDGREIWRPPPIRAFEST
jgi:hypothetical protein